MFSSSDESLLSHSYFNIILISDLVYEVQSICTGHYWRIISYNNTCIILHKHKQKDEYHFQKQKNNLFDTILLIATHDQYQLNGRSNNITNKNTVASQYINELLGQSNRQPGTK